MSVGNSLLNENIDAYNIKISREKFDWIKNIEPESFDKYTLEVEGGIKYFLVEDQYYFEKNQITKYSKSIRQPITMQGVEESSTIYVEFDPHYHEVQINSVLVKRDGISIDKLESADMQVLRREYQAESNILSGDLTLSIILDDVKTYDLH